MHINWWTLALQAINVLVLIWLLSRFLYRPIVAAIAARQAEAEKLLADAAAEKDRASAEAAALKAQRDLLAIECDRVRAEVRTAAEADRAGLLASARAEASKAGEEGRSQIALDRQRTLKELETQSAMLAADMAGKLVRHVPAALVQLSMFQTLIDQIAAIPDSDRANSLGAGPLTIVTAARMDEAERARCRDAVAKLLPQPMPIAFEEDPALIEGCELHGAHVHIRNSWRADLDSMLEQLAKESVDDRRA